MGVHEGSMGNQSPRFISADLLQLKPRLGPEPVPSCLPQAILQGSGILPFPKAPNI
jgi:hypothetical protein